MALQPPSPQNNVPRDDVHNVVDAMLFDSNVKWISIVFETTTNGIDRFVITPFITDPAN